MRQMRSQASVLFQILWNDSSYAGLVIPFGVICGRVPSHISCHVYTVGLMWHMWMKYLRRRIYDPPRPQKWTRVAADFPVGQ